MEPLTSINGAAVVNEDGFSSGVVADQRVRTICVGDGDDADDSDDSDELDLSVDIGNSFLDISQR